MDESQREMNARVDRANDSETWYERFGGKRVR